MPKRTVKHNHLVSTYPCNNGYVTETVNRNGETIRTALIEKVHMIPMKIMLMKSSIAS